MLKAPVITSFAADGESGPDDGQFAADGMARRNDLGVGGTAVTSSLVSLFDGVDLLGLVKSDSASNWHFFAGPLSGPNHSFTASSAGADSNKSETSAAFNVAGDAFALALPDIGAFHPGEPSSSALKFPAASDNGSVSISHATASDTNGGANDGYFLASTAEQAFGAINDAPVPTLGELSDPVSTAPHMQLLDESGNRSGTSALASEVVSTMTIGSSASGFTADASADTETVTDSAATVIGAGATVEVTDEFSGRISFAGATGMLIIDHSSSFIGTISGQLAIGDVIDLADIAGGANVTIAYSGNNSPGTLTVSDGTHTASIALLGNYSLANFTASSDGHGGTLIVDPPLPAGVTLRPIDGGPNYYANNGFTYAANAGWDSPNFFAIGPWLDMLVTQSDANRWLDVGWNTAFAITDNSSLSLARTNGISVIQVAGSPLNSGAGAETVGFLSADENYNDSVTAVNDTANSIQDHRFWWLQNTWTVEAYGDIGGTPMSQIMSEQLGTPNGTTRHLDTVTADTYFFSGSKDGGMLYSFGQIYGLGRAMTVDEGARGSNYGDMLDILRADQPTYPAPLAQFIETGEPGNAGTDAAYITPPELNWAVWSSIIHGAREIIYFNHTFTGSNQSDDNLAQPFYQTVQPGQTISIYNQVKATDALVEQLAPVLNSPFALNYVTVKDNAPQDAGLPNYSFGSGVDLTLGGLEVMAKDYNGQFYIFADTRDFRDANQHLGDIHPSRPQRDECNCCK